MGARRLRTPCPRARGGLGHRWPTCHTRGHLGDLRRRCLLPDQEGGRALSILHRTRGPSDPTGANTNLQKVLAISQVNRRRAVGDRKVLFVAAALPIMLILVIGFVSGRDVRAPLGIVTVDRGPIAARLVSLLDSFPSVQVHLESNVGSERDAVLRGQLLGALVVPDDFDASVSAGRTATLQVLTRSGNTAAFQ